MAEPLKVSCAFLALTPIPATASLTVLRWTLASKSHCHQMCQSLLKCPQVEPVTSNSSAKRAAAPEQPQQPPLQRHVLRRHLQVSEVQHLAKHSTACEFSIDVKYYDQLLLREKCDCSLLIFLKEGCTELTIYVRIKNSHTVNWLWKSDHVLRANKRSNLETFHFHFLDALHVFLIS